MSDDSKLLKPIFATYRALLDQLPNYGFYVLFFKEGVSLMLPMKTFETRAEVKAVEERDGYTKVVLDGRYQFRLWFLGLPTSTTEGGITLVSEHLTKEEMDLKASTSRINFMKSGPGVPMIDCTYLGNEVEN